MNGPAPQPVARNPDGTVKPGESLRKKSMRSRAQRLSRRIARATRDGQELLEIRLRIARDDTHRDQAKALEALETRLWGKAPQVVDLEVSGKDGAPAATAVLAGLTAEQLVEIAKGGK